MELEIGNWNWACKSLGLRWLLAWIDQRPAPSRRFRGENGGCSAGEGATPRAGAGSGSGARDGDGDEGTSAGTCEMRKLFDHNIDAVASVNSRRPTHRHDYCSALLLQPASCTLPYSLPLAPLLPLLHAASLLSARKRLLLEIYSFNNVATAFLEPLPGVFVVSGVVEGRGEWGVGRTDQGAGAGRAEFSFSCVFSIYASITSSFASLPTEPRRPKEQVVGGRISNT